MLFRRRRKPDFIQRLIAWLWPRNGWRRTLRYVVHRLARLPGTPYGIAIGFACGAAASVFPMVGFHFGLAALLAWALRGSIVASAIGTIIGNPWTFPAIWWSTWWLGNKMIGGSVAKSPNFIYLFGESWQAFKAMDFALISTKIWPVWVPMLIGSLPLALLAGLAVYFPLYRLVEAYQHGRLSRRRPKSVAGDQEIKA